MGRIYYIYRHFLLGGRLGIVMGFKCMITSNDSFHILVRNVCGVSDELLLKYGIFK
jgi:hypothetical protein